MSQVRILQGVLGGADEKERPGVFTPISEYALSLFLWGGTLSHRIPPTQSPPLRVRNRSLARLALLTNAIRPDNACLARIGKGLSIHSLHT